MFFRNRNAKTPPERLSLPLTLQRRRIYILPTSYGLLFIITLAGMLMGSVNYNNNLGFLLTFLLGSMAFVSMIHTYKNHLGIQLVSARAAPVFAGDRATFEVIVRTIQGRKLAIDFGFKEEAPVQKDLPADADVKIELRHSARERGYVLPGPLIVATRYPLGLFRSWSLLYLDVKCLVYPRPLPAPFQPTAETGAGDGDADSDIPGADDFQGLRSYQPGDSLHQISWKAYSRGQGLFTKTFTAQTGAAVLLDWDRTPGRDVEKKLSRLCDMALKAHGRRIAYGLNLPGRTIAPDVGHIHKHRCLKALALFGTESGTE